MNAADRLAEIQTRADNATDGPWYADGCDVRVSGPGIADVAYDMDDIDAEFIASARADVPALVAALDAVLELHKPVKRYVVDGYEEVSYESREQAVEETECDPSAVTEWVLCEECCRVEDGPDGVGPQVAGYANSDHPCTTYLTMQAAFEKAAS